MIKPYSQLEKEFHEDLMEKLRKSENNKFGDFSVPIPVQSNINTDQDFHHFQKNRYCMFIWIQALTSEN